MRKYFRISAVLTVIGALILGALGSGLWELLFKPLLFWVSTVFLNIATLGINSLRDDLYVEIAKGHDPSGLITFNIIVAAGLGIFVFFVFIVPFITWLTIGEFVRKRSLGRSKTSSHKFLFFRRTILPFSQRVRFLRGATILFAATAALQVGMFIIIAARETFIANGVVYLDQSQRAIAPYLTDNERIELRSRAAQMKSRLDFDKLNSEIVKAAQANKVQLPAFAPF
jgi:cation transport ATPase